jgi:hypothetical protein
LPDEAVAHPVLKASAPKSSEPSKRDASLAKHGSLEIPDDIGLAPLEPP